MTVREKAELIVKDIKKEQGTNPVVIFKQIAEKEYISIHGPEHHILDGASLLVAYKNAGGEIDLEQALDRLMSEGLRMPGECAVYGEYAEQSHPLALHLQSSTEQVRFQQMEHGEIICSLPRKQLEN